MKRTPVISLLTDFGTQDYFVAAVKGVILTNSPSASIIDITHEVPAQDIEAGAFTLLTCYRDFPERTIHMAVVDPGVGSTRRPIVVRTGSHYFVGPDNGLFSYVLDHEPSHKIFHVTAGKYFRQSPSPTFHGRDVFAPVAAALANGIKPHHFGPRIYDAVRLAPLAPVKDKGGSVKGRIIHIDRFGNCITNLTRADIDDSQPLKLLVKRRVISSVRQFFAEEHASPDELFAIWGSAGFLELAINGASAATLLRAKRGDPVVLE